MRIKKIIICTCAAMMVALYGCSKKESVELEETPTVETKVPEEVEEETSASEKDGKKEDAQEKDGEQIENPFEDCKSLKVAEKKAGFKWDVPEDMDGYDTVSYRVMKDDTNPMIEIIYSKDGEDKELRIRKVKGDVKDYISGDYEQYPDAETIKVDDLMVDINGNDGSFHVATWNNEDYTYSVGAYSEEGLSYQDMAYLISDINK